jgi:hypothetical protein
MFLAPAADLPLIVTSSDESIPSYCEVFGGCDADDVPVADAADDFLSLLTLESSIVSPAVSSSASSLEDEAANFKPEAMDELDDEDVDAKEAPVVSGGAMTYLCPICGNQVNTYDTQFSRVIYTKNENPVARHGVTQKKSSLSRDVALNGATGILFLCK